MTKLILKYYLISLRIISLQTDIYLDADSLVHGIGLKEIVDVIDDKVMSLIDLLEEGN